jgi:hypothetical protein
VLAWTFDCPMMESSTRKYHPLSIPVLICKSENLLAFESLVESFSALQIKIEFLPKLIRTNVAHTIQIFQANTKEERIANLRSFAGFH